MFVGKPMILSKRVKIEMSVGKIVMLIKSIKGIRYKIVSIVSHNALKASCYVVECLEDKDNHKVKNPRVR